MKILTKEQIDLIMKDLAEFATYGNGLDAVADAQLASCEKEFEAWKQKEADWLEKWRQEDCTIRTIEAHIASLREVK